MTTDSTKRGKPWVDLVEDGSYKHALVTAYRNQPPRFNEFFFLGYNDSMRNGTINMYMFTKNLPEDSGKRWPGLKIKGLRVELQLRKAEFYTAELWHSTTDPVDTRKMESMVKADKGKIVISGVFTTEIDQVVISSFAPIIDVG